LGGPLPCRPGRTPFQSTTQLARSSRHLIRSTLPIRPFPRLFARNLDRDLSRLENRKIAGERYDSNLAYWRRSREMSPSGAGRQELAFGNESDAVSEVGSPVQDLIIDSRPPLCMFVMAESRTVAGRSPGQSPPNAYLDWKIGCSPLCGGTHFAARLAPKSVRKLPIRSVRLVGLTS
jgi:hypothetical protein